MTGLDAVVAVLGSQAAVARAAGVHPTLVGYWKRKGGVIPYEYRDRLRLAALAAGAPALEALADTCPCCGRPME